MNIKYNNIKNINIKMENNQIHINYNIKILNISQNINK